MSKDPPKVIKGILKKPKTENEVDSSDLSKSQIAKSVSVLNPANLKTSDLMDRASSSTPLSVVTAYQKLNQQHLSTQQVDSAFEEYLKIQEELAARGEIEEAIKNLQEGLDERLGLYPPKDRGVWMISKLLAEIGIRMAVRSLNSDKLEKANQYLKLARKHTEPLPNSDWSENPDWMLTRKNVFKNLALYQQKKEEWEKALDCFKVSLKLEKDLKENTANTSLTCAVILSKLNKYAESIDHAQNCMNSIEQQMGIDRNRPLAEYKQFGQDSNKSMEYDKAMTTYAISLHLLGKNLANLKYVKEAKVFLSKAQYVAINMLNKPKPDLQLAITNDLNNLNKNYKVQLSTTKNKTQEDIEASLVTIKTNLANSSYSQADQQEQKALVGVITDGPPVKLIKKEEKKDKKKKHNEEEEKLEQEEDDDKKVYDFVKRFADEKRKKDNELLDEYHKRIQQEFDEKQKDFIQKQQQAKQQKLESQKKQFYKANGQFNKEQEVKETPASASSKKKPEPKTKKSAKSQGALSEPETKEEERVKKPSVNPAAEGAKLDRKGVKYSSEKGNKNFFDKRKQNIERVNERLGLGTLGEGDEDLMTEVKGGTGDDEEAKRFDLSLPPIKGYKIDSLNLGTAGERVFQKYEGYQSDQSMNDRSQNIISIKDPGTRKLLQTIENSYRKNVPSSLKKEYKEDEEDEKLQSSINPIRQADGTIKEIPQYKPPAKDWRDQGKSSSDDELPDPQKVLEKLGKENFQSKAEDLSKKLHIIKGDTTKYEEVKKPDSETHLPLIEESKLEQTPQLEDKTQKNRVTVLTKPPRAQVPSAIVPKKKNLDHQKSEVITDVKHKMTGSVGRSLGMTSKGSPRQLTSDLLDKNDSQFFESRDNSTSNQRGGGQRKNLGQKQPSQLKKGNDSQYVSPAQKRKQRVPWGGPDSDEARQKRLQNMERLNQLSQPKPKTYVLVKEDDDDEDEEDPKVRQFREQLEKGRDVNFSAYVDREVPYIKNNVKGMEAKSLNQSNFDTKINNKSGLFSNINSNINEHQKNKDPHGEVKYIQDKKIRRPLHKSPGFHSQKYTDAEMLNITQKGGNQDQDPNSTKNFKGFLAGSLIKKFGKNVKKLQNLPGLQAVAAKTLPPQSQNNLTLKELRYLEFKGAQYIQKMVRGYFTRKWYLNYMVRRRLGVPFSGLEFSQNPFLRQFNKPNQRLHEAALIPPSIVEVVQKQAESKNLLQKQYKHGKSKKKPRDQNAGSDEEVAKTDQQVSFINVIFQIENEEEETKQEEARNKVVPRRIPKGATPDQLLNNLQKDFLAQGLDAYTQFKKMGAGIDHDDHGHQIKEAQPKTKQIQKDEDELSRPIQFNQLKWRGNDDQGFLDVQETDQYLSRTRKAKSSKKQDNPNESKAESVDKQNFVSSLAAFAQVHGVFRKPSPLTKKDDTFDQGDDEDGDDIQSLLKRRRQQDEDEEYFPLDKYQEFSREFIVFYKKIGDHYIKWTVYVGAAFKKDKKFYIPVKILGEPMKSRNTIVVYIMNLEILKISKDIDKNFEFETIWPFILYLFNNWVRHQVKLMGLIEQRPELKGVFNKPEANMYEVQEFDKTLMQAKEEYHDMLNFSSEIEFDDRFDIDKYKQENHPDRLLDRSKPKDERMNPISQLKHNKKMLFNAYKQKINVYEQLMQMEDDDQTLLNYNEEGQLKKRVRIQLNDNPYGPVSTRKRNPFDYFLKMHYIPLPKTDTGQYKLIQNLQSQGYAEILKKNGLNEENMALMNEERRKRKGLPPLQILDYNCIDRAALKLKTIVECLYLRRQLNGWCLIPRDVKESLKAKEWQLRKQKNIQIACKMPQISAQLLKTFGMHIEYQKQYNEKAIQIEQSMKKIQEYKQRKQIQIDDVEDKSGDQEELQQQIPPEDEVLMHSHRQELKPKDKEKAILLKSQGKKEELKRELEKLRDEELKGKKLIEIQQDAIGKLMDLQKTKLEVEDFIREHEILEQGIVKIEDNAYIITIIFRKIKSNYENMRALIDERVRRFTRDSDDEEPDMLERMKARICEYVSTHPEVLKYDETNHSHIKEMEKIDIEQEKFTKKRTVYKSYLEIKICSKINLTNWDDSFNVNWEQLEDFFAKFKIKWKPNDFLSRRKFNSKERFTFYNFFARCLFIQDCRVHLDLNRFNVEAFKFDVIYLNLDQIKEEKQKHGLFFYYDDYLDENFDETEYDYPIFPFYEDPRLIDDIIQIDKDSVYFKYEPVLEDQVGQSASIQIVEGKTKPDLLIDETTKAYLNDPNNNFNLTLSNFQQSEGIYLGSVMIGGNEGYKNRYNLRIDYYVLGYVPTLQIKAFNAIYYDVFDLKVTNKKIIKDVIRICHQSQMSMVVNQLQSMISINRKLNGNYLKLNFNVRRDKNINLGQNYINMLLCNENLLRTLQKDNYRQFQGIVYFENFGGRMLVTVTEFDIEAEQLSYNNTDQIQLLHGNKHLPADYQKQMMEKGKNRNISVVKKTFQRLRLWKINIFNIFTSKDYDAVVSYEDLVNYYESELFSFYKNHPNMVKPNLVYLLQDYIRNLFIYRSKVGSILYWKLPYFRRPLDANGQYKAVTGDQLYQLKLLNIYQTLQKRIEEQNRDEDSNALPFSLDQMKAKKQSKEPPSLSLRNKLIAEKELPIYSSNDSRVLKLTSSNQEVIVQVPKVFKSLLTINYCIITVILYPLMECWMWQIYFVKTQRTFSVSFYPSDLFNMDQDILNFSGLAQAKNAAQGLWMELIRRSDLIQNPSGDILLVCETFREPLKEILFQDHVFNENALDIFFMEVTFKTYGNYVTDVRYAVYPMDLDTDEVNDYTISIRAFSLTRNVWVKDYQPLSEVVRILKQENYLTNNVKLLYYSMLKDAATLLAHKIVFSDEAKTAEIKKKKLTYDIKQLLNNKELFQKLQDDVREPPLPDKRKRLDKKNRKEEIGKKLDETYEVVVREPGLRSDWQNQIELNKIIYQGVASQNPVQIYTIIYNDVKDLFIYRLYRLTDSSTFERRLPGHEIQRTCAPNYQVMIREKMTSELGERIALYYKVNMLVGSLMDYYNLKK